MIAEQVVFKNPDGELHGGFMVSDASGAYIICGCCGGIFHYGEIGRENIKILSWVNLDDEICDNERL